MLKNISMIIVILIFTGCIIKQPYITEYTIQIENFSQVETQNKCVNKTLKVLKSFANNTLMDTKMNYIVGTHKQFFFTKAQWNLPVNEMVTIQITNMIDQLKIFKSVQNYKSMTKNDYTLQSNIIDFKQYFSEDLKSSYVKVHIKMSLIDNSSNKTIDSRSFISTIEAKSLDSFGGVKSLNEALVNVLKESSSWINLICNL